MKKIITIALLCYTLASTAQSTNRSYSAGIEVIENPNYKNFKELNVNNIPTGVLLEYGYAQLNIEKFNGTLQDSTYTTKESVSAIYYTLLSAIMKKRNNTNTLNLPQKWQDLRKVNTVTLGGVLYKYNKINLNAITSGRMQIIPIELLNDV